MLNPIGLAYAFGYTFLLASANIMLRSLSAKLSPSLIIGIRAVVGTLFVLPVALLTAPQDFALLTPERLLYLCGSVFIGGVFGSTCNVIALRRVGVSRAAPITNTSPLFAVLFSYLILHEPLRPAMLPGTLLVIAGIWLISRASQTSAQKKLSRRDLLIGMGFGVATAILWGVTGVILSLGLEGINSIVANSVRTPVVAIISMGAAASQGQLRELRDIDRRTALLLLLVGTLGYGVLSTLFVSSVQSLGPSLTQIISTLTPLFALPLSMVFLKEKPAGRTALGAVLAVAGIVVVLVG